LKLAESKPIDPSQVLGIGAEATDAEIRRAYFARVQEHPPERDPEGFKTMRAAYEQLRDPKARAVLFLDRFEEIPLDAGPPDLPQPVRLTRELLLMADPRCEVSRKDFSDDDLFH
jgi:preprotein translocase subunit Sec63